MGYSVSCLYYAGATDFRASRGWLEKFMKRHGFSLRRRTTVSQRLLKDLVPKVTMIIIFCMQRIMSLHLVQLYPLCSSIDYGG